MQLLTHPILARSVIALHPMCANSIGWLSHSHKGGASSSPFLGKHPWAGRLSGSIPERYSHGGSGWGACLKNINCWFSFSLPDNFPLSKAQRSDSHHLYNTPLKMALVYADHPFPLLSTPAFVAQGKDPSVTLQVRTDQKPSLISMLPRNSPTSRWTCSTG